MLTSALTSVASARDAEVTEVPLPGEIRVADTVDFTHDRIWSIGARLALRFVSNQSYAGQAPQIFGELGALIDGGNETVPWAFAPEVNVRRGIGESFGVVGSASFWERSISATFPEIGIARSTIGRDVFALRLLGDVRSPATQVVGLFAAAGPTVNFVRSFSTGYFSDSSSFAARPGVHLEAGVTLHTSRGWAAEASLAYDLSWFPDFGNDLAGGGASSDFTLGFGGHYDL